jgi:hypothetical protein
VPGWSRRYGRGIDSWKMPASKTKQDALTLGYGRDGFALLGAVYAPGQPTWLRELPAVQVLRQVLVQNYTRTTARNGREVVKRREKTDEGGDGLPPASIRLTFPYDMRRRYPRTQRRPGPTHAHGRSASVMRLKFVGKIVLVTRPGFVGGSIRREDRVHGSQVPLLPGAAPACGAHGR